MKIEFAEIVQDSSDEPLHLNIWVDGVCRSFLVEDVLAKMDAVEQPLAPDAANGDGIACPICGEKSYCVHRDN
jgi:hypothetical protein